MWKINKEAEAGKKKIRRKDEWRKRKKEKRKKKE